MMTPPNRSSRNDVPTELVEKKARCGHRLYETIASSNKDNNGGATLCNNFTFQVTQHVLQGGLNTKDPKNMALSPVSIDAVLGVLAAGAEGETLEQLLKLFGFKTVEEVNASVARLAAVLAKSDGDEGAPDISFANGLWLDQQYDLKASFKEIVRNVHNTEVRAVDFQNQADEVVREANKWVERQSKGAIKQILQRSSIKEQTRMILANALYFKGDWYEVFKSENTTNEDFHLLNGDKVEVPFMILTGTTKFDYGMFEGCQVLRMMYKEGDQQSSEGETPKKSFSMYVFLPEERDGLPNLLKNIVLDASLFEEKIKLKFVKISKLAFPKFAFDCEIGLSKYLQEMGLELPFDENCMDFTGIVELLKPGESIYVDDVYQKCRVDTNEEGTTTFVIGWALERWQASPHKPPPINFVADHPFMFVVREDFSGALLLVGTVLNPLCSS